MLGGAENRRADAFSGRRQRRAEKARVRPGAQGEAERPPEIAEVARLAPMRVFADAAPLTQRGTIVKEDPHLFKSFRLSILL